MEEGRLKELSKIFKNQTKSTYYVLSRPSHNREIFFKNNKNSFRFLKLKLLHQQNPQAVGLLKYISNLFLKSSIYIFLRLQILQPFLRRVVFDESLGDVILVGGQIKCFDFSKKEVISFPRKKEESLEFINSKKLQKTFSLRGVAPRLEVFNQKVPFTSEKIYEPYKGGSEEKLFDTLLKFYKVEGINKVPLKNYLSILQKLLKKSKIQDQSISRAMSLLKKKDFSIYLARIHGEFCKEQILISRDGYLFVDWDSFNNRLDKNIIVRDLIRFFREKDDLLNNHLFLRLLKKYPLEVQKNIKEYLLLNEIYNIARIGWVAPAFKKKLDRLLEEYPTF